MYGKKTSKVNRKHSGGSTGRLHNLFVKSVVSRLKDGTSERQDGRKKLKNFEMF